MWFVVIITGIIAGVFDADWPPAEALLLLFWLALCLWYQHWRLLPLLILSYLLTSLHLASLFHQQLPGHLTGKELLLTGHIVEVLKETAKNTRFLFQVEHCQNLSVSRERQNNKRNNALVLDDILNVEKTKTEAGDGVEQYHCDFHGRVALNLYHYSRGISKKEYKQGDEKRYKKRDRPLDPKVGESWQFQARLFPIKGFLNPEQSLYAMRQMAKGIAARGYIRSGDNRLQDEGWWWPQWLSQWQESARGYVQGLTDLRTNSVSDHSHSQQLSVQGFLSALLLADTQLLSSEQWQILQQTGTVHLVVVSGLHLGVLLLIGYSIARFCNGYWPMQRWSQVLFWQLFPVLLILPLLLIWPLGVAVQRALWMSFLLILVQVMACSPSPWRILWLALTGLLLVNPLLLLSPGLYYSVLAVFLLLFFVGQKASFWRVLQLQFVLFVGLLLVQSFWSNLPGSSAWLANLVAIPLVTLIILPLSLLSLVLPIEWLQLLLEQSILLFWQWLVWCQNGMPWSLMFDWSVAIILFCSAILLALPYLPARQILLGTVLLLLLFSLSTSDVPSVISSLINSSSTLSDHKRRVFSGLKPGQFTVEVLDVGQGLAVYIQTRHHHLLYDTGPRFASGFAPLQLALLSRLEQAPGLLDKVVISHDDNDHAGALPLLQGYFIGEVLTGQPQRIKQGVLCGPEQSWQWDGVRFDFLYPTAETVSGLSDNNRSCVLKVYSLRYPDMSVLLTGDIEQPVEQQLVETQSERLKVRWLLASHHGSGTGSSLPFLRAIQPQGIIYSAGLNNRFRHPAEKVQARSRQLGIGQYLTAEVGMIRLAPDNNRPDGEWLLTTQQSQLPGRWLWQR